MELSGSDWIKLNELLDQALDIDPARRQEWLDSLPPQRANVARALRDLLSTPDGPPTRDILRPIRLAMAPAFDSLRAGDIVGVYRLLRPLGIGGSATVWLAERADGEWSRQVALKLPHEAWIDRGIASRLDRERDILASLEHPHIARFHDGGVDQWGRPYLALEYVDGVPLGRHVRERELSLDARVDLWRDIAKAVAFGHAQLVIHGDIKPGNVLVRAAGDVRVLDFGISRLLHSQSGAESYVARDGRALTPYFAAPEQFTSQPTTVRTDVYSLGVLLYWLLTGRSPYVLRFNSLAEIEHAILRQEPLPLTHGLPRLLARPMRGDLQTIVRKAMARLPSERYETVDAFIEDIERFQRRRPVLEHRQSWWRRLCKSAGRSRV